MYTDPERSHVSCNVSSLMGSVSVVVLFRQHSEGEEGVLYIWLYVRKVSYIYGCIFMEDKQNIFEPDWKFVPP
jgi:hypothetical protein